MFRSRRWRSPCRSTPERHRKSHQPDHSKTNNNTSFDQGSVFVARGAGSHLGGFAQITYRGVDRAWSWDNLDLRAVGSGKVADKHLIYGLSLNNNPTVEVAWNTLPAWGYPYTGSDYAPSPAMRETMTL